MVRRQAAVRTLHQQARVWSVRVLLNLLVVALLGAAFYGVFWATESTVELQVWRGLREEGPGVLEPMFSRVEGTDVYDSWDLSRDGGLCLDLKLQSAEGRRVWGRTSSKAPSGPQSLFSWPSSLSEVAPCPANATVKARGGLPSIHFHRRGQLTAATSVQVHCPTGGLYQEPPDRFNTAQVQTFWGGLGMMAGPVGGGTLVLANKTWKSRHGIQ